MPEIPLYSSIAQDASQRFEDGYGIDFRVRRQINFDTKRFAKKHYSMLSISTKNIQIMGIWDLYRRILDMRKINFVTIRLSKSDKPDFEKWFDKEHSNIIGWREKLVLDGYKVGASFDPERDAFIVAVTGTPNCVHNTSNCFTSRSDVLTEAEMMCYYKHYILANGEGWDTIASELDGWG